MTLDSLQERKNKPKHNNSKNKSTNVSAQRAVCLLCLLCKGFQLARARTLWIKAADHGVDCHRIGVVIEHQVLHVAFVVPHTWQPVLAVVFVHGRWDQGKGDAWVGEERKD